MQGIGILMGGVAYVIVLHAFQNQTEADYTYLDIVWRIVIGLGIIPGIAALYFRLTVPETPRYSMDVNGDTDKAARDVQTVIAMNSVAAVATIYKQQDATVRDEQTVVSMSSAATISSVYADDNGRAEVKQNSFSDFCNHFGKWENFKVLFGVAYSWFALDVACKYS
jgi:MFS transporter, PHS family, inorganic phosphate transporter